MITVTYKATFVRQFDALEEGLQNEVLEKIELFKNQRNHKQLKVHKLHGPLHGRYGFSVNYKFRIVFGYSSKNEVVLLAVGDHDVYR
ncbi:MAG: type II toxin-antitoxin system mRNA interferase toxin, RelE/StbE family [Candidatus Taylorbacteria bacterium CG11_big_fil_rev_8_21_14_0_20_46_11]|uniref:Type II toxin-antitoxin system mRNA interferase toxin, RelE/StbE family n=1 Tax=Candidatus Taylorbacteria bacterium CG11_big_fil_rev_8_21_14_0_20_46_11 TaxID=1975025 RepID=A0A2H0KD77_9BACT|nr:MAG: type II toxin-antitoxin system mRNA interferase toxin, RelE/StbE family [Candidatus Taylorbacteria bacterium CG11_big_fil_rev_8_21_14_0_20_46_11]